MDAIGQLQEWYLSQCNGDWEHTYGVRIDNIDNPGWRLIVELTDTYLENVDFTEHKYGTTEHAGQDIQDWLICKVEERKFVGYGGPRKLEEMINVFLIWARGNA